MIMKKLTLMLVFVAAASTFTEAANYYPQDGKNEKSKSIKAKKPLIKKSLNTKAVKQPVQATKK
jgi:hypothetical protein